MTLFLNGITNENEFYTNYYLSEILENDLKEIGSRWRDEAEKKASKTPPEEMRALATEYSLFKNNLSRENEVNRRLDLQREFSKSLLDVLGYKQKVENRILEDDSILPILCEIKHSSGESELWIVEGLCVVEGDAGLQDPLELTFSRNQFLPNEDPNKLLVDETIEDLVSKKIFSQVEPPRWVIIVSDSQILLIDRTKWNDQRLLRFDLDEILARRDANTLTATCTFLHSDSILSTQGQPLLDTIDEKSHKHSQTVTQDLKYALQKCIEIVGNEAIYDLRTRVKEKIYEREIEKQLTFECLQFMYRLLFILYMEAREELGYAPMKADAYRLGYSFEGLRDLEVLELTTEEDRQSCYIHDSIKLLFDLIYNGYPEYEATNENQQLFVSLAPSRRSQTNEKIQTYGFELFPLRSHLFDPAKTPLLNKVRLRNSEMLQVLKLMSLSKSKGGKQRSGRISYAQLGINQLGAVYEALLCFSGFFAEKDLFEVQPSPQKSGKAIDDEEDSDFDDNEVESEQSSKKLKNKGETRNTRDELEIAYLVPLEDLEYYAIEERVFDEDGKQKKYEKGRFIYRLAGRDRQKSASYYTPDVLTKCLVKYSLKELLKDKSADEILNLNVCEPAMGSAAFLNECVNQLAEVYLERRQYELDKRIPHDEYLWEKQRVKMFIADRNVFGVDLNPVAVELAEVSLWLNSIYDGAFVPWFGMQLVCGNSLIGARKQVYVQDLLCKSKKNDKLWYEKEPLPIKVSESRSKDQVYHFLLPNPGMCKYADKEVRKLAKEQIQKIDNWRTKFTSPFNSNEVKQVLKISDQIDILWKLHIDKLREIRETTTDSLSVFGRDELMTDKKTSTEQKDAVFRQEGLIAEVVSSSSYSVLKLVMDYWCSLWFWPILQSSDLPTRDEYIAELEQILSTANCNDKRISAEDLETLVDGSQRLKLVRKLSNRYKFLHWELEFADIFFDHGGFDLVIGNPPWIKFDWEESGILGDFDPRCVVKKIGAADLAKERNEIISQHNMLSEYLSAYEDSAGIQGFVTAVANYPSLRGVQSNSYKCFISRAWEISNSKSISALIHPPGVFDDPKGGRLRNEIYKRLKYHFRFRNALNLFPILHTRLFSLNVYGANSERFSLIANLFHPKTIDACFEHEGNTQVPGIKDDTNKWDFSGHNQRVVIGDATTLALFARLYDMEGTPSTEARLPSLHSMTLVEVLKNFAKSAFHLRHSEKEITTTVFWDETNARKDGTIRRETRFPNVLGEMIYSGPHIHVGNPLWKTPRRICTEKGHYDVVDLESINSIYMPRTNYVPDCPTNEYVRRIPEALNGTKVTDYFRLMARKMLSGQMERTLISCIIPPTVAHTNAAISLCFRDSRLLLRAAAQFFSLPFDFFIKVTGKSNLYNETLMTLPVCQMPEFEQMIFARVLGLNCITEHYQELWNNHFDKAFLDDYWTNADIKIQLGPFFDNLTPKWNNNCGLRSDLRRRQALVELDVLIALAFKISREELIDLYRIQFPVLRNYERETFYDQTGRIIFTSNKGLHGVGVERKLWEEIKTMQHGVFERVIEDDTLPSGPVKKTITYTPPFFSTNREHDYEIAWKDFLQRLSIKQSVVLVKDEKISSII